MNDDTFVSPIDALLIINELNSVGSRELPIPPVCPDCPPPYFDVNCDGWIAPIDALIIINYINAQAAAAPNNAEPANQGKRAGKKPRKDFLVGVTFETTGLAGNPIFTVTVGEEFLLNAYAEDLRAEPQGVWAAYIDIEYPADLATPAGAEKKTWPENSRCNFFLGRYTQNRRDRKVDSSRPSGTNPVTEERLPGVRLYIAAWGQTHRSPISRASASTTPGAVGLNVRKRVTHFHPRVVKTT